MNVKQAIEVLKDAKQICLAWDGSTIEIDLTNDLMLDAFSNYVVKEISAAVKPNEYEIIVKALPVRENT